MLDPTKKSGGHLNNFDALRLIGALLVFYSHQFAISGRPEPSFFNGGLGVVIFFSVSGFLVMNSWKRNPHVFLFLTKRFLRLWPGMAVAAIISACLIGPAVSNLSVTEYFASKDVPRYAGILVFSVREGNFFPTNPFPQLNGSLWTIPIEAGCYILLAISGGVRILKQRWTMPLSLVVFAAFYVLVLGNDNGLRAYIEHTLKLPLIRPYVYYGLVFLFGVSISCYGVSLLRGDRAKILVIAAIVGGLLLMLRSEPELALLLAMPIVVISVGVRSWPILRDAGHFGDFSYGIYLYAWPVQQTVVWILGKSTPYFVLFSFSFLITALLAFLSWHLVEKHALKLKATVMCSQ